MILDEKIRNALNESLIGLAKFQTKPTEKLWNKTAKQYKYLSSTSMKLITQLDWENLYFKVKTHQPIIK